MQLKNTEFALRNKLNKLLTKLTGLKFVATLVIEFEKIESDDATKYNTFYSHSKTETIINESNIDDAFKSIYTRIISNIKS